MSYGRPTTIAVAVQCVISQMKKIFMNKNYLRVTLNYAPILKRLDRHIVPNIVSVGLGQFEAAHSL